MNIVTDEEIDIMYRSELKKLKDEIIKVKQIIHTIIEKYELLIMHKLCCDKFEKIIKNSKRKRRYNILSISKNDEKLHFLSPMKSIKKNEQILNINAIEQAYNELFYEYGINHQIKLKYGSNGSCLNYEEQIDKYSNNVSYNSPILSLSCILFWKLEKFFENMNKKLECFICCEHSNFYLKKK